MYTYSYIKSYWSLSCDHGLHCNDELMREQQLYKKRPPEKIGKKNGKKIEKLKTKNVTVNKIERISKQNRKIVE